MHRSHETQSRAVSPAGKMPRDKEQTEASFHAFMHSESEHTITTHYVRSSSHETSIVILTIDRKQSKQRFQIKAINMKRNSLSLFLVGAFLSSLTFFAQAHGRPQLTRQSGTRRLLQESSAPWLQEDFPSPEKDRRACGASSSRRLCDPDGILSSSGKQNLEEYLATKKHIGMTKNECLDSKASDKLEDGGDSETGNYRSQRHRHNNRQPY